jgi:hypothetical protein
MRLPDDPDELIALADQMLADRRAASDEVFRISVLEARAMAHRESRTGSVREHMALALRDYEEVLAQTSEDDPQWPARALNVAVGKGEQMGVDTRGAARDAAVLPRRALARASPPQDPRLVAMLRTNLALALMASDDGSESLREARELCYRALDYRSPERDAEDWAYTIINLGAIVERLHNSGEGDLREAERLYRSVAAHAHVVSERVVAHAHLNLLRLLADQLRAKADEGQETSLSAREPLTTEMLRLATQVASDAGASRVTRGRAQRSLAILAREDGDLVSSPRLPEPRSGFIASARIWASFLYVITNFVGENVFT